MCEKEWIHIPDEGVVLSIRLSSVNSAPGFPSASHTVPFTWQKIFQEDFKSFFSLSLGIVLFLLLNYYLCSNSIIESPR